MKHQALFSSKDKSKKLKCRLLQFLFGAFRVKVIYGMEGEKSLQEPGFLMCKTHDSSLENIINGSPGPR